MPRRKRLNNIKNFMYIDGSDDVGRKWKKTEKWKEFTR